MGDVGAVGAATEGRAGVGVAVSDRACRGRWHENTIDIAARLGFSKRFEPAREAVTT